MHASLRNKFTNGKLIINQSSLLIVEIIWFQSHFILTGKLQGLDLSLLSLCGKSETLSIFFQARGSLLGCST